MILELTFGFFGFVLLVWLMSSPFYWKLRQVPSNLPWPVVGNSILAFSKSLHDQAIANYFKWDGTPYYGFHFFTKPALGLRDPELIRNVLCSDSFQSLGIYANHEYDIMAASLLCTVGEQWKQTRSKLSPFFSPMKVKGMLPIAEESLKSVLKILHNNSFEDTPVDVVSLSLSLSTDCVTKNSFGIKSDAFEEHSVLVSLQKEMLKIKTLIKSLLGLLYPRFFDFMRFSILGTKINNELGQIIKKTVKQRMEGIGIRNDIMQGMVELMKTETNIKGEDKFNSDGTRVAKFDERSLLAHGITLYMAGTEALGNTLSFLLYELALNFDVQDFCRKEILEALILHNDPYEIISMLPYTSRVIYEVLRLYPLLGNMTRKCTKDYQIDNFIVNKGQIVSIPIAGIHRDPKYFPEPSKFDPERHRSDKNIVPGTFLPFGHGQRICLGMKFGMSILLLAAVRILSTFRIEPCNKTDIPIKMHKASVTLSPKTPIWLVFKSLDR